MSDENNQSTDNELTISAIMPVYNGQNFILKSLPPLIELMKNGEIDEVLVVDDTSTDNTCVLAKEMGAKVMPSGGRLGPGAARNKAAEVAKGNILWFIDADVIVHSDAAQHLKENLQNPDIVALFGSYDDKPPAQNFLSQYKNLVHHFYHHRGKREASTFWSGCGAVRKQAFLDAGGFDVERYTRPSIEDIELGYRLIKAGGKILLVPELQSTHLKVWRFINLIHTEVFCRAIPWSKLMLQQTGVVDDLNVSSSERFRAVLAGLLLICTVAAIFSLIPWWPTIIVLILAIFSNKQLLSLFYRRKGLLFAIGGFAFHQLYYLYSSLAFVYSWIEVKALKRA
ncbi:MAG: glycosyltransferase [Gammaproteobacteria bacterium]